jgi:hypothetical protein
MPFRLWCDHFGGFLLWILWELVAAGGASSRSSSPAWSVLGNCKCCIFRVKMSKFDRARCWCSGLRVEAAVGTAWWSVPGRVGPFVSSSQPARR